MAHVQDIGTRVELVPMDGHHDDISIGLYQQDVGGKPTYRVYSYSIKDGTRDRIAFIREAMKVLGGMVDAGEGLLGFSCGRPHLLGTKRIFLEACKLATGSELTPKPLETLDRKSGLTVVVRGDGQGGYGVKAEGESDQEARRIAVVVGGLAKLGEMEQADDTTVVFPCGTPHDELTGLLLVRAPNVRAVIREEQATASRGVLAAPSQQK